VSHIEYSIKCTNEAKDWLIAGLSVIEHNGILEEKNGFKVYITPLIKEETQALLIALEKEYTFSFSAEELKDQNWNAKWENDYKPVIVDDFCSVIAPFHSPNLSTTYTIVINPKMAFGTGHHATTQMMIAQMQHIAFKGKTVLDLGCGTGVLAILATKLGASKMYAVDNDIRSVNSTTEAKETNQTPQIIVSLGSLQDFKESKFNVILANINRNFLLDNVNLLANQTSINGELLMSGFQDVDINLVTRTFEDRGFEKINLQQKEDWASLLMKKRCANKSW